VVRLAGLRQIMTEGDKPMKLTALVAVAMLLSMGAAAQATVFTEN